MHDGSRLMAVNDPLLAPLIRARDDEARRAAIGAVLVTHARPVVERVLARYRGADSAIGPAEAEDLAGTVMLRLVQRLQHVAEDAGEAIASLADFTATLTFNAVYDFLRRRYPERTRLKNRVRYVLLRDRRFRTWSAERGAVCALAAWDAHDNIAELPRPAWKTRRRIEPERVADAVEAMLVAAGRPVLVDDLVRSLAEEWQVVDRPPVPVTPAAADPARAHSVQLETRQYLDALWREILELRAPQRAALLLNLRDADGGNAVVLFILAAIATFDEIAAAMEMAPERLTEIWTSLPLDDLAIAARLGLTRQQVINLRKAARARLARRMGQP
ncbi:MAG TPA: hypothetical protein VF266_01320 [Thermoanaerobaculia bacterium]